MLHAGLPVYLREVRFGTEKVDGETRKRVQCALVIAPFTAEMADELGTGIREHVFRRTDAQPIENLSEVKFKISHPAQQLRIRATVDSKDTILIENVKVDSDLKVRRDKETPTFEATIWIDFPYPTAEILLFLANQQNEQIVTTFLDSQLGLLDQGEEMPKEAKLSKKKKADPPPADPPPDGASASV